MKVPDLLCLTVLPHLFVFGLNSVPPAPSIVSPVLLANTTNYEFPSPDNTTFTNAKNALPEVPWAYHVPQTSIQVSVLYFEIVKLTDGDMLACLLHAANDVITQIDKGALLPIGQRELTWVSTPVRLSLFAEPELTWVMWGAAIRGLTHFLDMYDPVAILFDVLDLEKRNTVGGGSFYKPKPSTTKNSATRHIGPAEERY